MYSLGLGQKVSQLGLTPMITRIIILGMAKTWNYGVGDTVTYVPFSGGERRVEVTARLDDVKGGQPGFDGQVINPETDLCTGEWVWGYDEQIVKVTRKV